MVVTDSPVLGSDDVCPDFQSSPVHNRFLRLISGAMAADLFMATKVYITMGITYLYH